MTSDARIDIVQQEIDSCLCRPGHCFVGICGLGGSGKTTLAYSVAERRAGQVKVFETDWYISFSSAHRRAAVSKALDTGDNETLAFWSEPTNWYDWPRLLADLATLRQGGEIRIDNAWQQKTGERDLVVEVSLSLEPSVLIVDGIYLLHPEINSLLDRTLLLEVAPAVANDRTGNRDKTRIDDSYLAFKRSVVDSFDLPYLAKYRASIDRSIS